MSAVFGRVLLFGYGRMAQAMLEGWLASGLPPAAFTVHNPRPKPVPAGVTFAAKVPDGPFDAVVLAVKPQRLEEVAPTVAALAGPGTVLVSVLAGITLPRLEERFPRAAGTVRMMPNLAAALRKSPTALVAAGLGSGDEGAGRRAAVTDLAERLGSAEWLADEGAFDLVTALAGSGPGFVYRFIDALAEAATGLGLDSAQAQRLALRMVEGAAALAVRSDVPPAELARRVASPGGMTQRGLDVLDDGAALTTLLTRCLAETRDRGAELGAGLAG